MTAAPASAVGGYGAVAEARAEMLSALVDELNLSGIAYCLLSGYEGFPKAGDSDLDFMVQPRQSGRVVPILRAVARRCGAALVQAIQHETEACYYALAKPAQNAVAYLHPDCTTDYRREGRLWLRAEELLAGRRRLAEFYVPAAADELLYYLIKKVLKHDFTAQHLRRLRDLYAIAPEECSARMRQFWPAKSTLTVVRALQENDLWQLRWYLPLLTAELLSSPPVEGWPGRPAQRAREWRRRAARVVHPTGLSIAVSGGSSTQRAELAAALERNLRGAFRRSVVIHEGGQAGAMWQWAARVRSTLVVRKMDSVPTGLLTRDQECFNISEALPDVETATNMVLQRLKRRLEKRLSC